MENSQPMAEPKGQQMQPPASAASTLSLAQRRAFMRLSLEERRRLLRQQVEEIWEYCQQNIEWQELETGDIVN